MNTERDKPPSSSEPSPEAPRSPDGAAGEAPEAPQDLRSLIDKAVEDYLADAPPPGDTSSVDPDLLAKLISRLDSLYWRKAFETLERRLEEASPGDDRIPFTDEDFLLLDFGLLDERLLRESDVPALKKRLLEERSKEAEAEAEVLYFSHWLQERYRYLLAIEEVGSGGIDAEKLQAVPALRNLMEKRDRLLDTIRPYLRRLPGVPEILSRLVAEGRLDDLMLRLFLERMRNRSEENDRRLFRLEAAYRFVLHRVAERVPDDSYLRLLDEYNDLRLEIFRQVKHLPAEAAAGAGTTDEGRVKRQLLTEMKLLRTLLNLGTATSGISRPHSVLLRELERADPDKTASALALVAEADPRLPLRRTVLIAPFTGGGFFEWDRDTMVVSLIPARSVEESVVQAVAGLRISLDKFHNDEKLRHAYSRLHPERDFTEAFTRDYLVWVLRVARGQRQQMSQQVFDFFLQHIGHNGVDPVPLHELTGLTLAQKNKLYRDIVEKLRKKEALPGDLLVAGVIRWQKGDYSQAARYIEQAARMDPDDPRITYSLGILLRNTRQRGAARNYLLQCTRSTRRSIWQVYAFEALKRLRS